MKDLTASFLFLVIGIAHSGFAQEEDAASELEAIRAKYNFPALGSIVIINGETQAPVVVGLRKYKDEAAVTADDKWHIGSCTKAMTATLAATFVEAGDIEWDTTVGDILGEKIELPDAVKPITLHMLVSHRSGIRGSAPSKIWASAWKTDQKPDIVGRRLKYVESMLREKLEFAPGTKFEYSNTGFIVAGAMLEQISGKSWEALMMSRIFKPLEINSAGFGAAAKQGEVDQPWGHHGPKKPQAPGPGDDNPDILGPAGTVHASLSDIAKFVKMHTLRETGPVLKYPETFAFLQTVASDNSESYACGWIVTKRGWAQGTALTHAGTNTMNYCVIWIAPERKFAAIVVSNVGGNKVSEACDAVASMIIQQNLE